jgi:hypothetical protein
VEKILLLHHSALGVPKNWHTCLVSLDGHGDVKVPAKSHGDVRPVLGKSSENYCLPSEPQPSKEPQRCLPQNKKQSVHRLHTFGCVAHMKKLVLGLHKLANPFLSATRTARRPTVSMT